MKGTQRIELVIVGSIRKKEWHGSRSSNEKRLHEYLMMATQDFITKMQGGEPLDYYEGFEPEIEYEREG